MSDNVGVTRLLRRNKFERDSFFFQPLLDLRTNVYLFTRIRVVDQRKRFGVINFAYFDGLDVCQSLGLLVVIDVLPVKFIEELLVSSFLQLHWEQAGNVPPEGAQLLLYVDWLQPQFFSYLEG